MKRTYHFCFWVALLLCSKVLGQQNVNSLTQNPSSPSTWENLAASDLESLVKDNVLLLSDTLIDHPLVQRLDSLWMKGNGRLPDDPEALGPLNGLNWDYQKEGKTYLHRVAQALAVDELPLSAPNADLPDPQNTVLTRLLPELPSPGKSDLRSLSKSQITQQLSQEQEGLKEIMLKEKAGLWPRNALWENIIGIAQNSNTALNLSTGLVFPITPNMSLGGAIGFNYQKEREEYPAALLTYRAIGNYAVIKSRLAIRAEHVSLFPDLSYLGKKETELTAGAQHDLLLGATYTQQLKGLLALDMTFLYNLSRGPGPSTLNAPVVFRLGFKIIK